MLKQIMLKIILKQIMLKIMLKQISLKQITYYQGGGRVPYAYAYANPLCLCLCKSQGGERMLFAKTHDSWKEAQMVLVATTTNGGY